MIRPSGDNHHISITDYCLLTLQNYFATPLLKSEKLVDVSVSLHTNLLIGEQAHQDQLRVWRRIQNLPKIIIRQGQFLNVRVISNHNFYLTANNFSIYQQIGS